MTSLFKSMIDRYNEMAYTHNYIWGFEYKKVIYMAITKEDVMPYVCKLDRAAEKNDGMAIRFCPNTQQKMLLMTSAQPLCSAVYFKALCNEKYPNKKGKLVKYNNGEVFEKLVTEHFNQVWVKDNVPFTKDGDLTVNGIAYQIKFEKATFCNEKSLNNLSK